MEPKACEKKATSPHPLIFAAEWLEKVGYTRSVDSLNRDSFFVGDFLKKLAMVVRSDGSFNGQSPFAERVAIMLARQEHDIDATVLFLRIVDTRKHVLLVHNPPQNGLYHSSETADEPGELGYLGVLKFGEAALKCNRKEIAKKLFLELVERIPATHSPRALSDARIMALGYLKKLGVTSVRSRIPIDVELKASDEAQQF